MHDMLGKKNYYIGINHEINQMRFSVMPDRQSIIYLCYSSCYCSNSHGIKCRGVSSWFGVYAAKVWHLSSRNVCPDVCNGCSGIYYYEYHSNSMVFIQDDASRAPKSCGSKTSTTRI